MKKKETCRDRFTLSGLSEKDKLALKAIKVRHGGSLSVHILRAIREYIARLG